jgi:hypothetical protein
MAKCIVHICRECGKEEDNWTGHCLKCGAYNSFSKTTVERKPRHRATTGLSHSGYAGQQHHITKLNMVKMSQELRCSTGIDEFDRVLGGGLVTGSVVLIGGDLALANQLYFYKQQPILQKINPFYISLGRSHCHKLPCELNDWVCHWTNLMSWQKRK